VSSDADGVSLSEPVGHENSVALEASCEISVEGVMVLSVVPSVIDCVPPEIPVDVVRVGDVTFSETETVVTTSELTVATPGVEVVPVASVSITCVVVVSGVSGVPRDSEDFVAVDEAETLESSTEDCCC
jgi:hypothetical protein